MKMTVLVPLHRGFEWLCDQGWQFFWFDQELDASRDARCSSDQAGAFEIEHHLMDGWWADAKVTLQLGFGGRAAEHAGIGVDEGEVLALLGSEAWSRGRGIHVT